MQDDGLGMDNLSVDDLAQLFGRVSHNKDGTLQVEDDYDPRFDAMEDQEAGFSTFDSGERVGEGSGGSVIGHEDYEDEEERSRGRMASYEDEDEDEEDDTNNDSDMS